MAFADAFAYVEPEQDLGGDQGVEPSLLDGEVFPCTGPGTLDQVGDSSADGWNVTRSWWCQLNLGVFQENIEFRSSLSQQICEKE